MANVTIAREYVNEVYVVTKKEEYLTKVYMDENTIAHSVIGNFVVYDLESFVFEVVIPKLEEVLKYAPLVAFDGIYKITAIHKKNSKQFDEWRYEIEERNENKYAFDWNVSLNELIKILPKRFEDFAIYWSRNNWIDFKTELCLKLSHIDYDVQFFVVSASKKDHTLLIEETKKAIEKYFYNVLIHTKSHFTLIKKANFIIRIDKNDHFNIKGDIHHFDYDLKQSTATLVLVNEQSNFVEDKLDLIGFKKIKEKFGSI